MKNCITVAYEEKIKSQIMYKLVAGQSPSLKEIVAQLIEANEAQASYIISAYFHVKNEVVG
ncbi:MAG: hypothetical protein KBT36_13245 [Kurthia sp.]|nr:hypothetical protein [Candidatus Kurthia equi]